MLLRYRKRRGGIKLSSEQTETAVEDELNVSAASDDLATESPKELESHKEQKQKADALWTDFLKDVGSVPKKSLSNNAVSIITNTCCHSSSSYAVGSVPVGMWYNSASYPRQDGKWVLAKVVMLCGWGVKVGWLIPFEDKHVGGR